MNSSSRGIVLLAFACCVAAIPGFTWSQWRRQYRDGAASFDDLLAENMIDTGDFTDQSTSSSGLSEEDPLLNAGLFEGDIYGVNPDDISGRNAVNAQEKLWPNGTIPYEFKLFTFSMFERQIIRSALNEFEQQTCIRFTPRTYKDNDYVRFMKGKGCYSHVGRAGGQQEVSIGDGCVSKGIIMHEMNHVVGFWHEQSRPDRDDYVVIKWGNIQKGTEANFAKYPLSIVQNLNESYDYNSLMHYGPFSFSRRKNWKTIEPKIRVRGLRMGQRIGFTSIDLRKINKLYNCTLAATAVQPTSNLIGDIFTTRCGSPQPSSYLTCNRSLLQRSCHSLHCNHGGCHFTDFKP